MRESIHGYADAVLEAAGASGGGAELAEQLGAVVSLVRSSSDLGGVLADPGVPARQRRAVLTDLLQSRMPAEVVGLVGYAIEKDRAPEAGANLEWLERVAARAARGEAADDALVLSRHAAHERIDGYATAVLSPVAAGDGLGSVEDELFRFARIVAGNEALSDALTNRDLPAAQRAAVVSELLTGRAGATTVGLAAYATRVSRARDIPDTLNWLVERVAEESNRRVAEVRAAVALDENQRRRLGQALGRITGHPVDVRVAVAPELLGGFVAAVGDTLVDGSVRHRLDLLRDRINLPDIEIQISELEP
ncbi:MAG TPA: F0F1 ATP synthase subunit delta [Acidimicrobiales bacterium]|nr:F0F1 ATP synthase subunit delta [Acidimicrobiales bacterium]